MYRGREIRTIEDLAWFASEIETLLNDKNNTISHEDVMAISALQDTFNSMKDFKEVRKEIPVKNRSEILDI